MSRVRSRDTTPELAVRRAAHAAGHRFRLHRKDLPGTPDLVFPRRRLAVFVHGCFWHRHGCRRSKMPVNNAAYWEAKIGRNARRDEEARTELRVIGWRPFIIWTCELERGVERLLTELATTDNPASSCSTT